MEHSQSQDTITLSIEKKVFTPAIPFEGKVDDIEVKVTYLSKDGKKKISEVLHLKNTGKDLEILDEGIRFTS